jgi:hypothetical protein
VNRRDASNGGGSSSPDSSWAGDGFARFSATTGWLGLGVRPSAAAAPETAPMTSSSMPSSHAAGAAVEPPFASLACIRAMRIRRCSTPNPPSTTSSSTLNSMMSP